MANTDNFIGGAAVALGTFDGVHIGHQRLIKTLIKNANGLKTVVYAFSNIPANIFAAKKVGQLTTTNEKTELIAALGTDCVQMRSFTKETADMSCENFMERLFGDLGAKLVVVGFNYSFGKGARGDAQMLKAEGEKRGVRVITEPAVEIDGRIVSSTGIRKAIECGDVALAEKHLGRYYSVSGEVVHGNHIGHQIGFPTINFDIPSEKVIPKRGVYAACVEINGKKYMGMTNIGVRPTIDKEHRATIETHIFNYSENLYGKTVTVYFAEHIRDEHGFEGIDMLKTQLKNDEENVKNILYKTNIAWYNG